MDVPPASWRRILHRWRWLLVVLVLIILVRAALPFGIRYALVSKGSELLRAKVEVGDIDLWLLSGAVAIDDFSLQPLAEVSPASAAGTVPSATSGLTPEAAAEAPTTPPGSPPGPPDAAALVGERPLLAWKRLLVDVNWRPLANKVVQLGEISLEVPSIAVDRLRSGGWNYEPIVRAALELAAEESPAADATPSPSPTATTAPQELEATQGTLATPSPTGVVVAEAGGWQVGIDRIVIKQGHFRFHDLMLEGSEPVDVTLPTIDVKDVALSPGLYGEPARVRVELGVDDGSLAVDARFSLLDEGFSLDSSVKAERLPIRRGRLYIPSVGWSDLRGELDLDVTYGREPHVRDELKGTITLRDVAVAVPGLEGAALAWKRLSVRLDPLDMLANRVAVAEVDLDGLDLPVNARGEERVPIMRRIIANAEATPGDEPPVAAEPADQESSPSPTPTAGAPPPAPPTEPAQAPGPIWKWSVAAARINDSVIRVLADSPFDVKVHVGAENLASDGAAPATFKVGLQSDVGTIDIDGRANIQPPGFSGTIKIGALKLRELVNTSGALPPDLWQSGLLDADLNIDAGMDGQSAPDSGAVRVRGTLALSDLGLIMASGQGAAISLKTLKLGVTDLSVPGVMPAEVPPPAQPLVFRGTLRIETPLIAQADGKEFSVGAKEIDLSIAELSLPGLLPAAEPAPLTEPMRIALQQLRLDTPAIRITRTAEGIVIPVFSLTPPEPSAQPALEPPPTPVAPSPTAPVAARAESEATPEPPPTEPARPIDVVVDSLRLSAGRLDITDRAVKPPFSGRLSPINLQAKDVHWPAVAAKQLRLEVTTPAQGQIKISGDVSPAGGTLEINSRDVALSPYNAYTTTYSPYRVSDGALSFDTKVTFGKGRYDVKNVLTLHQFNVEGGTSESVFEKEFGIPISMALALMRDSKGDIGFDIPVQVSPEKTEIDVLGIAGQALRRAIVNALASPMKLFGAIAGGDQVPSLVPPSIGMRRGRPEATEDGSKRVEQVGKLLASRPGLAIGLTTSATNQDARWLHEQALLKQWQEQGFFGALRELAQGDTRENVQKALEARAQDETAELSAEDTAALDEWLKTVPPATPQQLQALAEARLATVQTALRDTAGIDAARIHTEQPSEQLADEAPVVKIQLQPVAPEQPSGVPQAEDNG